VWGVGGRRVALRARSWLGSSFKSLVIYIRIYIYIYIDMDIYKCVTSSRTSSFGVWNRQFLEHSEVKTFSILAET
jgi:hypothetical protein